MFTPRPVLAGLLVVLIAALAWVGLERLGGADPSPRAARATVQEPMPQAAEGLAVRVVARFTAEDQEPVRIAAHPASGRLYVLGGGGDVSLLDPASGTKRRVLTGRDYIDRPEKQDVNIPLPVDASVVNSPITLRTTLCLGLAFDRE